MDKFINLSNLERFLNNLKNLLDKKQDIAESFTTITTNDSTQVSLPLNEIIVFNTTQSFSSKSFNIVAPEDSTKEYTWTLRFSLGDVTPNITFNTPTGYTLKWANSETPEFKPNKAYEITFKYIPGVNLILGVCGGF